MEFKILILENLNFLIKKGAFLIKKITFLLVSKVLSFRCKKTKKQKEYGK